jgi:hypothetical protein
MANELLEKAWEAHGGLDVGRDALPLPDDPMTAEKRLWWIVEGDAPKGLDVDRPTAVGLRHGAQPARRRRGRSMESFVF